MKAVPTRRADLQQAGGDQPVEQSARLDRRDSREGSRRLGRHIRPRHEPEEPEQPLRRGCKRGVRVVEGGPHGDVVVAVDTQNLKPVDGA